MPSIFPELFAFEQLAPLVLRVVLGAVFIVHGYPKLFRSFGQTVQFFESVGIKPAKFWVFVAGAVEFFGGIFLAAGLFTQIAAALIAINTAGALFWIKLYKLKKKSFSEIELDLILLIVALSLLVLGPGLFAFDLPL